MTQPVPLRCSVFPENAKAQCPEPGVVAHYVAVYPPQFTPREQHPAVIMLCAKHAQAAFGRADE